MKHSHVRPVLLTLLIAVVVCGGVVAHGQRPQAGGAAPGPMLIDFSATTADGKSVTDLTAADLSIKVGGKVRTVADLKLKTAAAAPAGAPAAAGAAAAAPAASSIAPPYFTNEPSASAAPAPARAASGERFFLIMVDTESLPPGVEPQVKTAIDNLLKNLAPTDHVAFSIAPHDTAQLGFNTSLATVRDAVSKLRGQKAVIANTDDATAVALCRTSDTLNLLKAMMQQAPGGDTPMNMILIAGSLQTPGTASSKASTGTTCNVQSDQYASLAAATAAARVNVYVVQGDSNVGRDGGLDNLAGVTGAGAVIRVVNDGFAPRVLGESSAYWVATLAPDPSDKPNQSQRLELKTTKEGVTIHTRPEAMLSRPGNAAGAAPPAAGKAGTALKDIVSQTAAYTDLQLRAYAFAQRGAGAKVNVIVQVEPIDPAVKLTAVRLGYFDANNKGASVDVSNIAVYPITTGLPLDPGQYRLRVGATDASGKAGAVDMKIDTSLIPAGPFKMSGLMFLLSKDGKNSPRLQFTEGDTVTAMFEMYGIPNTIPMIVGFELVPAEGGTAKSFRPSGQIPQAEPDKFQIIGEVPAGLAPGDYIIRAIVQQKDADKGQSVRTLRILKK